MKKAKVCNRMNVKDTMKDNTLHNTMVRIFYLLMKLEGIHDGGMPEPSLVDLTVDDAFRCLIPCQIHKEIGS